LKESINGATMDSPLPALPHRTATLLKVLADMPTDLGPKDDWTAVCEAADELEKAASTLASAVPHLVQSLGHDHWFVRETAAGILGSLGSAAADAAPMLVERLRDEDDEVRREAIWALGEIGCATEQAISSLIHAAEADHGLGGGNKYMAIEALGKMGPAAAVAAPRLAPVLGASDASLRFVAAVALLKIGDAPDQAIEQLRDDVLGRSLSQREAIAACASLGARFPRAILPALVEASRGADEAIGKAAMAALRAVGAERETDGLVWPEFADGDLSEMEVATLLQASNSPAIWIRRLAVKRMAQLLEEAKPWIKDEDRKREALKQLQGHEKAIRKAIPTGLRDVHAGVRLEAAKALNFDTFLEDPMPPDIEAGLIAATRDSSEHVRHEAVDLLKTGYPSVAAIPPAQEALNDPSEKMRVGALVILAKFGPQSKQAEESLVRLLGDPSPEVRVEAANALARMGSHISAAAEKLLAMLGTATEHTAWVYNAHGVLGEEIFPDEYRRQALRLAVDCSNVDIRYSAMSLICRLKTPEPENLALWRRALADPEQKVRKQAFHILKYLRLPAAALFACLEPLLVHPNEAIRLDANEALRGRADVVLAEALARRARLDVADDAAAAMQQPLAELESELIQEIREGKKFHAIRRVRQAGMSLVEAKRFIESIESRLPQNGQ
jgi:HEAT repeat protein